MKRPVDILIEILLHGGSESCCPPDGYHDGCNLWELNGDICHECWYDYAKMKAEQHNKRDEKTTSLRLKGIMHWEDKLERRKWYRVRLRNG